MKTTGKKSAKQATRARLARKRKEDIGLSPYAVVFRGQQRLEKTSIRMMEFTVDEVRESVIESVNKISPVPDKGFSRWISVNGIHDVKMLEQMAGVLKIPPRILSDILNPSLRPKYEVFEEGLFITLKLIQFNDTTLRLSTENLSLLVTQDTLVSFREEYDEVFEPVRERLRKFSTRIRTSGADYLAFTLLDIVIDNYIYVLGVIGDKIEELDDRLTADPVKGLLPEINVYKQEISYLRKNILPAKEMIVSLNKQEAVPIQLINRVHFQELLFNINEAVELTDSYREILYDQISVYHTLVSARQNDILRILTLFSVIFIPLTFIVGVYGTNFKYFPELGWRYGYYGMWGVMLLIGITMWIYFRSRKWW